MRYKLLVLDIDGTIVGKNRIVSPEDKLALAQAKMAGVSVSLCTGRAPQGCRNLLSELSLDSYHTFHDGAMVVNPETKHEIYTGTISPITVKQAVEWAHLYDMEIELYSTTQFFAERENWSTRVHLDYFDIPTLFIDYSDILEREKIIKMQTVRTNEVEGEKISRFSQEFADSLHLSWVRSPSLPGKDFINILAPEVSKGKAVTELAAYLGIKKEEIIAIGDDRNDIPLLSAAGLAIAMEDAPPEVKQIARHITASVEQSGVAQAVKKFLL